MPRLYQAKGVRSTVYKCIECPKFSRCEIGAWRNPNPASTIAADCKLITIRQKTAARVEREACCE